MNHEARTARRDESMAESVGGAAPPAAYWALNLRVELVHGEPDPLSVDDGARPTRTRSSKAVADPPRVHAEQVILDTWSPKVELERPRTIRGKVSHDAEEESGGTDPTTAGARATTVDAGTPRTAPHALCVVTRPFVDETDATKEGVDPIRVVPAPAARDVGAGRALLDAASIVAGSGPTEIGQASTLGDRASTSIGSGSDFGDRASTFGDRASTSTRSG
jgi:hypothetical protein